MNKPQCPECGRHPSACWTMPCLGLEIAMANGLPAMRQWAREAGIKCIDEKALKAEIAERRERVGS